MDNRVPPHDLDAEVCTLGAMVLDSRVVPSVRRLLSAADFYRPAHQHIYRAIVSASDAGVVDAVAVIGELTSAGVLESAGGRQYMGTLMESVPSTANWQYYACRVRDAAILRETIQLCTDAARTCWDAKHKAGVVVDRLQQRAYELGRRTGGDDATSAMDAHDALQAAFDHAETIRAGIAVPGLPTGLWALDKAVCGFEPGELILLGAAPGCGKTAAMWCIALNWLNWGRRGVVVSREMKPRELGKRALQVQSGVPGWALKRGQYSESDGAAMLDVIKASQGWKGWIDSRSTTVADIVTIARHKAQEWGGLDFLCVDYLQLLSGEGDNRAQQVGGVSWELKKAAMDLNIPVLLLSQFGRDTNKALYEPPTLHSFKESGDVENNANTAILLWRSPLDTDINGILPIWAKVAKQRDGMVSPWPLCHDGKNKPMPPDGGNGAIELHWMPETTAVYSLNPEGATT